MPKQSNKPLVRNHVASTSGGPAGKVHYAAKANLKSGRVKQSTNRGSSK